MTWIGFISIMRDKRERKIDKAVPKIVQQEIIVRDRWENKYGQVFIN
jgi:hypothetical protein